MCSENFTQLLARSAAAHSQLCPRQVLGVRMGLLAGVSLGIDLPQIAKILYTIVESDGCLVDGIAAATNCSPGRRTLRVIDYGKVAATFIDTRNESACRITPKPTARIDASQFAPEARDAWHAMLLGYARMPDTQLLNIQAVQVCLPIQELTGKLGHRVHCEWCGEEIMNGREIVRQGNTYCRGCASVSYYASVQETAPSPLTFPFE
ncbi:MAG TPA: FmdE family protein [Anaerolineae bacterium]|nr:FmdE family protein [Anaerolineae bacterium]